MLAYLSVPPDCMRGHSTIMWYGRCAQIGHLSAGRAATSAPWLICTADVLALGPALALVLACACAAPEREPKPEAGAAASAPLDREEPAVNALGCFGRFGCALDDCAGTGSGPWTRCNGCP
jgi:hypothetical protein